MAQAVKKWLVVLVLAAGAFAAHAAPVPKDVLRDVQGIVQAQLDALAKDDAKLAFSYASPNIRKYFGTPERFMAMVQIGYPVVHRNRSVTFLKPDLVKGKVVQPVQMTDADGQTWIATYILERQKDKTWRIAGCSVVEDDRLST